MSFLLAEILLKPQLASGLTTKQYSQLIRQARSTNLLASLCITLQQAQVLEKIPPNIRRHLESGAVVHNKQKSDLNYDIKLLRAALDTVGEKLILLKGAAYLQAKLPVCQGRLIGDIDIIVPQTHIDSVEKSLNDHYWKSGKLDPYNQRYYRQWMHEIPPMGHIKRGTTLDLHHTILPPTAAPNVDASLILGEVVEVQPGIFTLSPRDMVIHSATHLFHEGEFHHGLRDLWDLHKMLTDFAIKDPSFWENLIPRAKELDLLDSLTLGLRYTQQVFNTAMPQTALEQANSGKRNYHKPLLDFLFRRAFRPDQPECQLPLTGLALYALFVRSHYLRMPLYLLIPHLMRKAWMSHVSQQKKDNDESSADD